MTDCRMIITDLDRTLLRSDGRVSAYTLDVLRACRGRGVLFAIATARFWIGAEKYIGLLRPDYEITTDGTLVHAGGACVYSCAFTAAQTDGIVRELLARAPGLEITVACGKEVLWNSPHIADSEKLRKAVYCDYRQPLDRPANKIVAELTDRGAAEAVAAAAGCRLVGYRGENWYTFLPAGAGKETAIRAMAGHSGLPLSAIAAFGDDQNDIDMLRVCGLGVAVGNALPEVRAAADALAAPNDEDGVARFLEKELLG